MNPLIQPKQTTSVFLIAFGLTCFGLLPAAQAVNPPPDGGYSVDNTAEGEDALFSLTFGAGNTAIGFNALNQTLNGSFNTGVGISQLSL